MVAAKMLLRQFIAAKCRSYGLFERFAGMARSYDLFQQAWSASAIYYGRNGPLLRFIAAKCRSYDLFERFAGMARSYDLFERFAGMARSYDLFQQAWSVPAIYYGRWSASAIYYSGSRAWPAPTIYYGRNGPLLRFIAAKCRSYDLFQRFAGMARSYNLLRLITDF